MLCVSTKTQSSKTTVYVSSQYSSFVGVIFKLLLHYILNWTGRKIFLEIFVLGEAGTAMTVSETRAVGGNDHCVLRGFFLTLSK